MDEIRAQVHDRPEVYNTFVELICRFKKERTETAVVIDSINALFANYPQLIEGFRAFLPADANLRGSLWFDAPPMTGPEPPFHAAMDYVNKIRARFSDDRSVYGRLLDILATYIRDGPNDFDAILVQIKVLFHGHDDLIDEFEKLRS